jgi:hypothetical protein
VSVPETRFQGVHCTMTVRRPAAGVLVLVIEGSDAGELGDAPMRELARDLAGPASVELFVDARATKGATVDVSNDWARWLRGHRQHLQAVHMLTASRYVQLTADLVRRFAELEMMRVYADPAAFDEALAAAVAAPR